MRRLEKLALALLVPMMLSMPLCGCLGGGSGEEIAYGGQYYPGEFLLQGHDFWTQYDMEVDHILFSSGTENNQALISGDVDINVGSDSKTVTLFNSMPDQALIIGTVQKGDRYSTVVGNDSEYQSWEDLKGEKVGTRLGTGAEQVLKRYFEQSESLDWDDYQWVNIGVEDMVSALGGGSIEAFTAWEPTPAIAESQGVGRVIKTFGDVALVPVSLHTTLDFAEDHRDTIVKFLAAQLDKAEMIREDPQEAAVLAAQAASSRGSDITADAFQRIFERIDFSIEINPEVLSAINDTAQFLYNQGSIDNVPELRWDDSYLQEAIALRG